jgi:hypothetical protein
MLVIWTGWFLYPGGSYAPVYTVDMANTVKTSDIDVFLSHAALAICSTYHTVQKASTGAAIFGWHILFDIPFLPDWNKIRDHMQSQTDLNMECEN